jgi:hypothetical protein
MSRLTSASVRYFCRMNRAFLLKISALATLLLLALGFAQAVWPNASEMAQHERFPEKVNLALRRTAHHLLKEAGDSISKIPSVERTGPNIWSVRLEHALNYDRLPVLFHESLNLHGISQMDYDVTVLSCLDRVLQLGYNAVDYAQTQDVPCGGRSMEPGCYLLQVTFAQSEPTSSGSTNVIWAGLGLALAGFFAAAGWRLWQRWRLPALAPSTPAVPGHALRFGNSALDAANLTLVSGHARHSLTYREAKLLQLFAARPNQVLERDFILKSVWEDEGIIVGRSVDVFVSRLRKLLRDDPSLRLVAVHGVGYRLESA